MLSFIQSITVTILLAFILRFFVLQPFIVEGSSMEPNFHDQEYVIVDKISYRFHEPKRGDVIVFHPPTDPSQNYIKRVIGMPGETVSISQGEVFINKVKIDEPYLGGQNHKTEQFNEREPVTLGLDEYFVMGDNRSHSSDSREWGVLTKAGIEGKTWFIALPFQNFQFISPPDYTNLAR